MINTFPALSVICSLLYFMPWIIEPRAGLGFYLLAYFWFLFVWIPMLGHLGIGIKNKLKREGIPPRSISYQRLLYFALTSL